MLKGDAKQLVINMKYFMRYGQKKNRHLPIHHPSPITHHPPPIRQIKKNRGVKNEKKPSVN